MTAAERPSPAVAGVLLKAAGLVFVAAAVLYNEALLSVLAALDERSIGKIRTVQLYLASGGVALILLGGLVRRVRGLAAIARRGWAVNALLAALVVLVPWTVAELTLRPFVVLHRKTTLFVRDDELGWRLRPGARDQWHGTPVTINAKGLRGPELAWTKPDGVFRILYLGDSVTFGYGLSDHRETFPYRVEQALDPRVPVRVETVNAGVGGYSPWQELRFLEREGLRYEPDLVVVSFVLNDVTEKLELVRFGGWSEGAQLANTSLSLLDRLAAHSAVVHAVRNLATRLRFGEDVREGARRREIVEVENLIHRPDDPEIVRAWELTADSLRGIFSLCRERDVPVLLVVFPFVFQLDDPEQRSGPQRTVREIAAESGVPVVDLLPELAAVMRERGADARDYFLDADHLSVLGSEVVGRILADRILDEGWVAADDPAPER